MSSVAFHSLDSETVRVGGAERAMASSLCTRILHGVLNYDSFPKLDDAPLDRLVRLVKNGHYIRDYAMRGDVNGTVNALRTALGGFGDCLAWNGHDVSEFSLALNTALVVGSDPMRLLARMHGQCEIHGWVAGGNRWWLSDIIEEGTTSGVIRTAYQTQYENWPGVVAMLRVTSQTPVVMSYSVTNSFPNFALVSGHDFEETPWGRMTEEQQADMERRMEAFDALDPVEQWNQAFAALTSADNGLEMKPENWKTFRFTHKLSAFDLLAEDWEQRFNLAFPAAEDAA